MESLNEGVEGDGGTTQWGETSAIQTHVVDDTYPRIFKWNFQLNMECCRCYHDSSQTRRCYWCECSLCDSLYCGDVCSRCKKHFCRGCEKLNHCLACSDLYCENCQIQYKHSSTVCVFCKYCAETICFRNTAFCSHRCFKVMKKNKARQQEKLCPCITKPQTNIRLLLQTVRRNNYDKKHSLSDIIRTNVLPFLTTN
jgi:hypothetical protein